MVTAGKRQHARRLLELPSERHGLNAASHSLQVYGVGDHKMVRLVPRRRASAGAAPPGGRSVGKSPQQCPRSSPPRKEGREEVRRPTKPFALPSLERRRPPSDLCGRGSYHFVFNGVLFNAEGFIWPLKHRYDGRVLCLMGGRMGVSAVHGACARLAPVSDVDNATALFPGHVAGGCKVAFYSHWSSGVASSQRCTMTFAPRRRKAVLILSTLHRQWEL